MSEKYICLDCETASRPAQVGLTPTGMCEKCGSSAVISCANFVKLAEAELARSEDKVKATLAPSLSPVLSHKRQQRIDSLREFYTPIRRFLSRNKLIDVDLWWDGWGAWTDVSFQQGWSVDSEPTEGELDWVRLVLSNADGSRKILHFHFDPEDESLRTVVDVVSKLKGKTP